MSVTALILSCKDTLPWEVPSQVTPLLHVSVITNSTELFAQRKAALMKVDTETFYYQDDDDPLPNHYPEVAQGLVYGDMYTLFQGELTRVKLWPYHKRAHVTNPVHLHKAFCNTEQAQRVMRLLPEGPYWTEYLLYYFLANAYGGHYDASLEMHWHRKSTGMHVGATPSMVNSIKWAAMNHERMMQLLK